MGFHAMGLQIFSNGWKSPKLRSGHQEVKMTFWWPQKIDLKIWFPGVFEVEKNYGDIGLAEIWLLDTALVTWPLTSVYISEIRSNWKTDFTIIFFMAENPSYLLSLGLVSNFNFVTFDLDFRENPTVKLASSRWLERAHHGLSDHVP